MLQKVHRQHQHRDNIRVHHMHVHADGNGGQPHRNDDGSCCKGSCGCRPGTGSGKEALDIGLGADNPHNHGKQLGKAAAYTDIKHIPPVFRGHCLLQPRQGRKLPEGTDTCHEQA